MSEGTSSGSAGWYPDPFDEGPAGQRRYWDGSQWTGYLQPVAVPPPPERPPEAASAPASSPSTPPSVAASPNPRPAFARGAPVPGPGQPSRVGFGPRLGAVLIDALVLAVAQLVVGAVLGLAIGLAGGTGAGAEAIGGLAGLTIPVVYWIVLHAKLRQTVGKRAVGAVVVDAHSLQGISHPRALGRYLAEFLSGLALGLGYLWVLWDGDRQGWHDKLASTLVVRKAELAT